MAVTFTPDAAAPNLRRLLTPDETLLYAAKFHPLRGWWLLVGALASFAASYSYPPALLLFLVLFALWYVPLRTNEVAVTDDRLLLRTGWMKLLLEAIDDEKIIRWQMEQNALGTLLDVGRVTIKVREAASTRDIVLDWVWHPVTLLEALQAMQDEKYRDAAPGTQA